MKRTLTDVNLQLLGYLGHCLEVGSVEVVLSSWLGGDLLQLILYCVAHSNSIHLEPCGISRQTDKKVSLSSTTPSIAICLPLTHLLGLLGSISNVVLAASICENDANLSDARPGARTNTEALVCQIAEGLAGHGSPLHVGHFLHSILQVLLVVVAAQGELLQSEDGNITFISEGRKDVYVGVTTKIKHSDTCLTALEYCTSPT